MPDRAEVAKALLHAIFRHGGEVEAFGDNERFVTELADEFDLDQEQRTAKLEYESQGQIHYRDLWHRLLFRAGEFLVRKQQVMRPPKIKNKRQGWILMETGRDAVIRQLNLSRKQEDLLSVRTYEIRKILNSIAEQPYPQAYDPTDQKKKTVLLTPKEVKLRNRSFRLAVIEAYDFRCAVCGLKLYVPSTFCWEVEAAHIVPHCFGGKDDVWNGIALCHLHHWAFDVGWFTVMDDFQIVFSRHAENMEREFGFMHGISLFERFFSGTEHILLPSNRNHFPHPSSLQWHREKVFVQ